MNKKIIGIKALGYPEKRNFAELGFRDYKFEKKWDIYRLLSGLYFKLLKRNHKFWLNLFKDFNLGKYTGLHFFNAVNMGSKPWVTTFENYLPRGAHKAGTYVHEKKYINKVITRLNDKSCVKLIALSQYAKNSQIEYLSNFDTKISDNIIQKIQVIHPAQNAIITDFSIKPKNKEIKLILVGADFFRKGGMEILEVCDDLIKNNYKIHLTIVSSMRFGDYATKTTAQDLESAYEIIKKHPLNIKHYKFLENKKVLDLFINSDLALLPSYGETYGYSVLEAQACGCPVITTNGGAFPEINNNGSGWIIDVPLFNGRSVPPDHNAKQNFKSIVKKELKSIILSVCDNPEISARKGKLALDRIKAEHCPADRIKALESIYNTF